MNYQSWSCYLVDGKVLIPTKGKTTEGLGIHIEPMTVVSILEQEVLKKALLETIARGNPVHSFKEVESQLKIGIHKKVGMKSYKVFNHVAILWGIEKKDDIYSIDFSKIAIDGRGFTPDTSKPDIVFPPNTPVEKVVDRFINIITQTYQEKKKETVE